MPIPRNILIEIKESLETELMCKTINSDRKQAIEQELQSIKRILKD